VFFRRLERARNNVPDFVIVQKIKKKNIIKIRVSTSREKINDFLARGK
jgi:hypothetical protein